jgi:hypothetical protein
MPDSKQNWNIKYSIVSAKFVCLFKWTVFQNETRFQCSVTYFYNWVYGAESREADTVVAERVKTFTPFWNQKSNYCGYKSQSFGAIISHVNPICILTTYFLRKILMCSPLCLRIECILFPSGLPNITLCAFLRFPDPPILTSFFHTKIFTCYSYLPL